MLVHCGTLKIRWELIAAAVNHICSFDHDEIFHVYGFLQSEIWSARIMIILQQSFQQTNNDGKLGLLHFLRRFCATDARDKVFGVLGMQAFQEISQSNAGPVENSWIQVDYNKSAADVYRIVAEKVIFSEPRNTWIRKILTVLLLGPTMGSARQCPYSPTIHTITESSNQLQRGHCGFDKPSWRNEYT